MVEHSKKEKTCFLGKRVEDQDGRLVGWQDEFGDMRTPRGIIQEVSGCLLMIIAATALIGGCTMRVQEEIQKRREGQTSKPTSQKVERTPFRVNTTFER